MHLTAVSGEKVFCSDPNCLKVFQNSSFQEHSLSSGHPSAIVMNIQTRQFFEQQTVLLVQELQRINRLVEKKGISCVIELKPIQQKNKIRLKGYDMSAMELQSTFLQSLRSHITLLQSNLSYLKNSVQFPQCFEFLLDLRNYLLQEMQVYIEPIRLNFVNGMAQWKKQVYQMIEYSWKKDGEIKYIQQIRQNMIKKHAHKIVFQMGTSNQQIQSKFQQNQGKFHSPQDAITSSSTIYTSQFSLINSQQIPTVRQIRTERHSQGCPYQIEQRLKLIVQQKQETIRKLQELAGRQKQTIRSLQRQLDEQQTQIKHIIQHYQIQLEKSHLQTQLAKQENALLQSQFSLVSNKLLAMQSNLAILQEELLSLQATPIYDDDLVSQVVELEAELHHRNDQISKMQQAIHKAIQLMEGYQLTMEREGISSYGNQDKWKKTKSQLDHFKG